MYPNQEITELRKAGRVEEAYQRGHELLKEYPNDIYFKGSFGWVLYDKLKQIVEAAREKSTAGNDPGDAIRKIMREYARLGLPRPDLLFSLLLSQILRAPTPPEFLPGLMRWAGLDCFRPEDLCAQQGKDGTVYEPLVEKVARTTSKVARRSSDPQLKDYTVRLLDEAIARGEVQKIEWLHYGKLLLLGQLGRFDEARDLLLPFVRGKRREFWAWHAWAKLEEPTDPQRALPLCAKAAQVCNVPRFGINVFEDLSRLAAGRGQWGLAKWAADRAAEVRAENDWRQPQSLRDLLASDWYAKAETLADPDRVLAGLGSEADTLIHADCPRHEATYLGTFTAKSGKVMVKVAVRRDDGVDELVGHARDLGDARISKIGSPVTVGVLDGVDRPSIIEIILREGGAPFDCVPEIHGVVDHQNHAKELTSIYLTDTDFCLLHYREFPDARGWSPGTAVAIRGLHTDRGMHAYFAKTIAFEENQCMKRVAGRISIHERGFGFVNDDVFVPPLLAQGYEVGQQVSLIAVKKRDKKTGKLGWTALGTGTAIVVDMIKYRKSA